MLRHQEPLPTRLLPWQCTGLNGCTKHTRSATGGTAGDKGLAEALLRTLLDTATWPSGRAVGLCAEPGWLLGSMWPLLLSADSSITTSSKLGGAKQLHLGD